MFVQATDFRHKTPALPGNARIEWQGIGEDRGYTVVHGDLQIEGGTGWYIAPGIGWTENIQVDYSGVQADLPEINLPYPVESADLLPVHHFPSTEWIGGNYRMFLLADGATRTFTRTEVPQWMPREWQWYYIAPSAQGTSATSDIKTRWFGDWWFTVQEGALQKRGFLRNSPSAIPFADSQTNPDLWIYEDGTGDGDGSGIYRSLAEPGKVRTVGWLEEGTTDKYHLNPDNSPQPAQAPVDMISVGVLRMPSSAYAGGALPTSWEFDGANWENPDPWDCRYWACIRAAMLERESVIPNHTMGTLVQYQNVQEEQYLFDFGPYGVPTARGIRIYRKMLVELAKRYKDLSKLVRIIEDGGAPGAWYNDEKIDLPTASGFDLGGGWDSRDAMVSATYGDLSKWLKLAKGALEKMGLLDCPKMLTKAPGPDDGRFYYYDSHGAGWNQVYSTGLAQDDESTYAWGYDTYHTAGTTTIWAEGMHGQNTPSGTGQAYYAQGGRNLAEIEGFNFPRSSVLDGGAMSPEVVDLIESRRTHPDEDGLEPGQKYRNGVLTAIEYYSANYHQGIYARRNVALPLKIADEFPQTMPEPAQPQGIDPDTGEPYPYWMPGYSILTNWTTHYFLAWWGDAFRFPAVWQWDDLEEDTEEEEEQGSD